MLLLLSSIVFIVTYTLLLLDKWSKVGVVMLGAAAMLLVHAQNPHALLHHVDLPVLLLLVAMMLLVNLVARTGVFQWLAFRLVGWSRGRGWLALVLVGLLVAVLSALLDNVTTVLLMLPLVVQVCQQLRLPSYPFFITTILASNIGGTATLIGDPPNLLIASATGLSFNDFLLHLLPIVAPILLLSLGLLVWQFRKSLFNPPCEAVLAPPPPLSWKKVVFPLGVMGCVFIGFLAHAVLPLEPYVVAMAGAAVLLFFSEEAEGLWHEVEWQTISFFVGLFILVGGLVEAGGVGALSQALLALTGGHEGFTAQVMLWGSGIASAIVDNIPYTATMIPLLKQLYPVALDHPAPWWALSLGACLGGNATLVGAAANVIVAEFAEKEGVPIRFGAFLRYGLPVTGLSLAVASLYLWLRY